MVMISCVKQKRNKKKGVIMNGKRSHVIYFIMLGAAWCCWIMVVFSWVLLGLLGAPGASGATQSSPGLPGAPGTPGKSRSSRRFPLLPEAPGESQELPGAPGFSRGLPGSSRVSWELLGIPEGPGNSRARGALGSSWGLPGSKTSWDLSGDPGGSRALPGIPGSSRVPGSFRELPGTPRAQPGATGGNLRMMEKYIQN